MVGPTHLGMTAEQRGKCHGQAIEDTPRVWWGPLGEVMQIDACSGVVCIFHDLLPRKNGNFFPPRFGISPGYSGPATVD